VAQRAFEVHAGDTLATLGARIHEAEHALYADAVRRYLTEPWVMRDRRLVFGSKETAHG
jgi:folate-dependent phosphoribosylglycinamide formyltransferase PurN